jgi:hypothetical protein
MAVYCQTLPLVPPNAVARVQGWPQRMWEFGRCGSFLSIALGLDPPGLDGSNEGLVVLVVLIGVGDREIPDGAIEHVA